MGQLIKEPDLVFKDEAVSLTFEDLQPNIIFQDESNELKFDIVNGIGIFDSTFDSTFE